jgi:hypothetical protein
MTTIKPTNAKETIENAVALLMKQTGLDKLKVNSIDLELADKMQQIIIGAYRVPVANVVRTALASHLAYVMEKMPPEKDARIKEWSNPRDYVEDFSYRESEERSLRALAYNDAIHRSKEVIQSEIDELTK